MSCTYAGEVSAWGCNLLHTCGPSSKSSLVCPERVGALLGVQIVSVAAGLNHSMALSNHGDLYGWGANDAGQLGNGSRRSAPVPTLVGGDVLENEVVTQVACGSRHDTLTLLQKSMLCMLACTCVGGDEADLPASGSA
jgi:alpha-tubulin suppressor-like RCC1 family protein